MHKDLVKYVLYAELGKNAAQRARLSGQLVTILVKVSRGAVFVGIGTLSDARTPGQNALRRRLHGQKVPCNAESDKIFLKGNGGARQDPLLSLYFFYRVSMFSSR